MLPAIFERRPGRGIECHVRLTFSLAAKYRDDERDDDDDDRSFIVALQLALKLDMTQSFNLVILLSVVGVFLLPRGRAFVPSGTAARPRHNRSIDSLQHQQRFSHLRDHHPKSRSTTRTTMTFQRLLIFVSF